MKHKLMMTMIVSALFCGCFTGCSKVAETEKYIVEQKTENMRVIRGLSAETFTCHMQAMEQYVFQKKMVWTICL